MPIRAVFFDFDGVIADTENVHIAAWERTFASMGWEVAPEVCVKAAEEDDRVFLQSVFAEQGILDGDVDGWVTRKQSLTIEMLSNNTRVYPGVQKLVEALSGRVKLVVVSGTWRENVVAVLHALKLESLFTLIVAKEDVNLTKPDPSAYLLALNTLGIKASEAVALEDSPAGLASVGAAGIRCLAIGHRRPDGDWVGDSTYLRSLQPIADVIERIGL